MERGDDLFFFQLKKGERPLFTRNYVTSITEPITLSGPRAFSVVQDATQTIQNLLNNHVRRTFNKTCLARGPIH